MTIRLPHKLELYRLAVQHPLAEAAFLARIYQHYRPGREATRLKEDFAGGAALAGAWVALHENNRALAVEAHEPTARWAQRRAQHDLGDRAGDLHVLQADVLAVTKPRVDVVAALNFSLFVYHQRPELCDYFRIARRSLRPGGILVVDAYGGPGAWRVGRQRRRVACASDAAQPLHPVSDTRDRARISPSPSGRGWRVLTPGEGVGVPRGLFPQGNSTRIGRSPVSHALTRPEYRPPSPAPEGGRGGIATAPNPLPPWFDYIWEQRVCDAATGKVECHIHFAVPTGGRLRHLRSAFRYDWRLWSLPELTEIMLEAGFARAEIWCDRLLPARGRRAGRSDGIYRPTRHMEAREDWIAYVVGLR